MARLEFGKYEGAGNDFLVVEAESEALLPPAGAQSLCDRHFGVGGDGVLLVLPAKAGGARARMVVLNADGSRPEMCGNGLRCVALSLAERDGLSRAEYLIETDAGQRHAHVERDGARAVVTLGMGEGRIVGSLQHALGGRTLELLQVDMGNPHAVAFADDIGEAELDAFAPALCARVPGGTNVEIVRSRGAAFDVLVWERGVGRTLACGTGAAAVAVAAVELGHAAFERPIDVHLPGGRLVLTVARSSLAVTLEGPARHVFSGRVET